MDDLIFNCEHCEQELSVDATGAGTEIECPSCGQSLVIPTESPSDADLPPMVEPETPDEPEEEKQFIVPQHETKLEPLITKPLKPLDASAKEGVPLRVKTFKRSECMEVGKDNFDDVVSAFLSEVGEDHIISVHPISYAHQDLASRSWVDDYGVMIVYRG